MLVESKFIFAMIPFSRQHRKPDYHKSGLYTREPDCGVVEVLQLML